MTEEELKALVDVHFRVLDDVKPTMVAITFEREFDDTEIPEGYEARKKIRIEFNKNGNFLTAEGHGTEFILPRVEKFDHVLLRLFNQVGLIFPKALEICMRGELMEKLRGGLGKQ